MKRGQAAGLRTRPAQPDTAAPRHPAPPAHPAPCAAITCDRSEHPRRERGDRGSDRGTARTVRAHG